MSPEHVLQQRPGKRIGSSHVGFGHSFLMFLHCTRATMRRFLWTWKGDGKGVNLKENIMMFIIFLPEHIRIADNTWCQMVAPSQRTMSSLVLGTVYQTGILERYEMERESLISIYAPPGRNTLKWNKWGDKIGQIIKEFVCRRLNRPSIIFTVVLNGKDNTHNHHH